MKATIIAGGITKSSVELLPGETILEALQRNGWHQSAPCGGTGRCGKCLVTIDPPDAGGPRSEEESRFTGSDPARRLACRTVPTKDLVVTLSADVTPPASGDTLAKGGAIAVETRGIPAVVAQRILLNAPSLADQRSVYRRLRDATADPELLVDTTLLAVAARALQEHEGDSVELIATVATDHRLLDLHDSPANGEIGPPMGVAIDIGTTTVAAYLVDLAAHEVIASRSEANAQGVYGADVISRIAAYGKDAPLSRVVRGQLASIVAELARAAAVDPTSIVDVSIVGNTTMLQLLLDLDPRSIARAPFLPTLTESYAATASDIGMPIHERGRIRLVPGVSAYVGADIVADLLASRLHEQEGTALLVDIGTNGEIVCGGTGGLLACSTAAGPAFEGATIHHGSGGVAGAINHVRRDGDRLITQTIADQRPASICGTGIMDTVAMLLDDGVIDETGRLDPSGASDATREFYAQRIVEVDGELAFTLGDAGAPNAVVFTQGDIRQVQLAKGAIAAGIRVLLDELGVTASDLRTVYLAGGFGTYVRSEAAVRVGLLPGVPIDRVVALGNAAGAGAARVLVDRQSIDEAARIAQACRYLELSGSARFQELYMEEMLFPSV